MNRMGGSLRKYNLYLSHTWNHEHAYKDLDALLSSRSDFHYIGHYVGERNPVQQEGSERQIYEAVKHKMKFCDVVLLLCVVYPDYSRWINKEIIACKDELNKPLIAVERYDSSGTSLIVKQNSDIIVGWNREEIVETIRQFSPVTGTSS